MSFHIFLMEIQMSSITDRRSFIGGSDARIIMGDDQPALVQLWQEKRGEAEPALLWLLLLLRRESSFTTSVLRSRLP